MKKIACLLLCFCLLAGCSSMSIWNSNGIPRFVVVDERLTRGARPNLDGVGVLQLLGVKTVISLEDENRNQGPIKNEVEKRGMRFVELPFNNITEPTEEQVFAFLDEVLSPASQPVFVYCENGKDMTGTMVAVYRTLIYGWGPKEAYVEAKKHGFWPYQGDNILKNYIHQLRDKKSLYQYAEELKKKYETKI